MPRRATRFATTLRQHPGVSVVLLVIAVCIIVTISVTAHLAASDGLDGAVGGFAFGTWLLAALAAVLAAIAYAQSVRRPVLYVEVRLDFDDVVVSLTGERTVRTQGHAPLGSDGVESSPSAHRLSPGYLRVSLWNHGDATARNVVVSVTLQGMRPAVMSSASVPKGWAVLAYPGQPPSQFDFDGGPNLAIHSGQRRPLPQIHLSFSQADLGATISAVATVNADGCAPATDTFEIRVESSANSDSTTGS
jgi:hypothetical protein